MSQIQIKIQIQIPLLIKQKITNYLNAIYLERWKQRIIHVHKEFYYKMYRTIYRPIGEKYDIKKVMNKIEHEYDWNNLMAYIHLLQQKYEYYNHQIKSAKLIPPHNFDYTPPII